MNIQVSVQDLAHAYSLADAAIKPNDILAECSAYTLKAASGKRGILRRHADGHTAQVSAEATRGAVHSNRAIWRMMPLERDADKQIADMLHRLWCEVAPNDPLPAPPAEPTLPQLAGAHVTSARLGLEAAIGICRAREGNCSSVLEQAGARKCREDIERDMMQWYREQTIGEFAIP